MPEETACYLCGHQPADLLFSARDSRHNTEGSFGWNKCPSCELVYLSPRPTPDEMSHYYPSDYALFRSAKAQRRWWQPSTWMQRRDVNRRCRAAMRARSQGRLLDVGCGTGEFLAAMKQRSWDTLGIEPSTIAADYARKHLGLEIRTETLENAGLPADSFDVVTLWTVLEHLYDPLSALRTARRILRPEGLLIISIPDVESLDARWFGSDWVGYDTPRHLYVYSRHVLRALLKQAGFVLQDTEHFQADYYTFLASFEPWLNAKLNDRRLLPILNRVLKFPGMRLLTWPLFWAVNAMGKGCIITVYARPAH